MRLIDADLMRKQIMEAGKGMEKNSIQEVGERMLLFLADIQPTVEIEAKRLKPKKVKDAFSGVGMSGGICPTCKTSAVRIACSGREKDVTYCHTCGQALEWE